MSDISYQTRKKEILISQTRANFHQCKEGTFKTAAKNHRNFAKLLLDRQIEGGIKHLGVDNYNEGVSARTCLGTFLYFLKNTRKT